MPHQPITLAYPSVDSACSRGSSMARFSSLFDCGWKLFLTALISHARRVIRNFLAFCSLCFEYDGSARQLVVGYRAFVSAGRETQKQKLRAALSTGLLGSFAVPV